VTISVVNSDGMTFGTTRQATSGIIEVSLDELSLTATPLAPAPYPVFLSRQFTPDPGYNVKPRWDDVEQVIIGFPGIAPDTDLDIQIMTIWIK
jgi:hypothetical protein